MKLTSSGTILYADAPPGDVELKKAGWVYMKSRKCWTASLGIKAIPFIEYADVPTRAKIEKWQAAREATVSASLSTTSNLVLPAPPGVVYRPYQLAGTAFMLARENSLNADVPRLGKTIQTLGVLNHYDRPLKTLVICPAIAKTNWVHEANKWLVNKVAAGYCEGDVRPEADFVTCNYEILGRHLEEFLRTEWDVVVFDEAHYLKNPDAKRTIASLQLKAKKHRLFLTGTPAFTRPRDLWTLAQECDPQGLGANYFRFAVRYCNGHKDFRGHWQDDGASNEIELQLKMRQRFMVRREKRDVAKEIPPNRATVVLPREGLETLIEAEYNAVTAGLKRLLAALDDNDGKALELLAERDGRNAELDDPISTVRRKLAVAKVPMVVQFCKEVMQTEPKIVVFAHHKEAAKLLAEKLGLECVVGGLSTAERDRRLQKFRNDPACRGIVGNITAMSTAISLKEADTVIFSELSWIPSELDQAEERIWDPEKTATCSIYRLVLENSLEQRIDYVVSQRQLSVSRLTSREYLGLA